MTDSCFFEKVLCAVELLHRSSATLYNAVAFAQPNGQLRVLTVEQASGHQADVPTPAMKKQALEDFVRRTIPSEIPYLPLLDFVVAFGNPAQEILRAGAPPNADLVVVGTRGRGRLQEAVVGSVAHSVLRRSQVPVMVIPPFETELVTLEATRPVFHLGRILVPVDPERVDANQLRVAARLRRASHDELLLLHVQRPGERAADAAQLSDLAKRHDLPPATEVASVTGGTVAQGIVDVARRENAGLIIMGLEREQKRMEPGAISYEVIRHTEAVVLAVPPS
ncbi:MAG: universal stress protein [Acidobacteria bacterium]|nr:universal stress protein [Acidobacteriota bacterium]